MNEKDKEISLEELCKVYHDRKRHLLVDRVSVPQEEKPVNDSSEAFSAGEHIYPRSKLQLTCHSPTTEFSCEDPSRRIKKRQNSTTQTARQTEERITLRVPKVAQKYVRKLPPISTPSISKNLEEKSRETIKKNQMTVAHKNVAEQGNTEVVRSNMQQLEAPQSTLHDHLTKFQKVQKQMATMALAHHIQSTNQDQRWTNQQTRSVTKLHMRRSHYNEQVSGYTRPLLHVPQSTTQGQRRTTQQMMLRRPTKQPMENQLVKGDRNSGIGDTLIRRQWCRRPGIGQHLRRVPEARHGPLELSMCTEKVASNETSIYQFPKRPAVLKQVKQAESLANKHKSNDHHNPKCQRNDQIKPKSSRIVIMNILDQGIQARRVAVQHGSNDHECSGRRNALCKQRDSTQQELTFIRVLRKRF